MSRTTWRLAASAAAWVFAATPAPALGPDPRLCGGRFVDQPNVPLQPGCRRWDCQFSYKPAEDEKGVYCIRVFACAVYCPKPTK